MLPADLSSLYGPLVSTQYALCAVWVCARGVYVCAQSLASVVAYITNRRIRGVDFQGALLPRTPFLNTAFGQIQVLDPGLYVPIRPVSVAQIDCIVQ